MDKSSDKPLFVVHTSESRKPLFEGHFMPSFKASGLADKCDLCVHNFGVDSVYGQVDFVKGVQTRCENLNRAFYDNPGRLVIGAGDDIVFYEPWDLVLGYIKTCLKYTDIVAMRDNEESLCCCFIAGYSTKTTNNLMWEWVKSYADLGWPCDQMRFNHVIRKMGISFGRLPADKFWTHGLVNGQRFIDDPAMLPDPPKSMVVHHANYAMTTEVKVRLIEEIKKKYDALNPSWP